MKKEWNILTKSIEILGEKLLFTNQRTLFWEREKALIISDLHIGKTAHFRKNGIAIPSNILNEDLLRLEQLIQQFQAKKLIIVGDFLHAGNNSDLDIFCVWRKCFQSLKIILVKGNHDKISAQFLEENCIEFFENKFEISPFTFIHEPEISDRKFCISGHIHPGVLMKQKKIQSIKLPCFAYSENQLVLPAFSEFTGLDYKTLGSDFVKIAFNNDLIFEV